MSRAEFLWLNWLALVQLGSREAALAIAIEYRTRTGCAIAYHRFTERRKH